MKRPLTAGLVFGACVLSATGGALAFLKRHSQRTREASVEDIQQEAREQASLHLQQPQELPARNSLAEQQAGGQEAAAELSAHSASLQGQPTDGQQAATPRVSVPDAWRLQQELQRQGAAAEHQLEAANLQTADMRLRLDALQAEMTARNADLAAANAQAADNCHKLQGDLSAALARLRQGELNAHRHAAAQAAATAGLQQAQAELEVLKRERAEERASLVALMSQQADSSKRQLQEAKAKLHDAAYRQQALEDARLRLEAEVYHERWNLRQLVECLVQSMQVAGMQLPAEARFPAGWEPNSATLPRSSPIPAPPGLPAMAEPPSKHLQQQKAGDKLPAEEASPRIHTSRSASATVLQYTSHFSTPLPPPPGLQAAAVATSQQSTQLASSGNKGPADAVKESGAAPRAARIDGAAGTSGQPPAVLGSSAISGTAAAIHQPPCRGNPEPAAERPSQDPCLAAGRLELHEASGRIMLTDESDAKRSSMVATKRDFCLLQTTGDTSMNVVEGLELHSNVLSPAEQTALAEMVEEWVAQGKQGQLRNRTFLQPPRSRRGSGRVTVQFGCCYNYGKDPQGRPPGILAEEVVEPMPPILTALCDRLVRWGILKPADCPDCAIVNVYQPGDCIPPHIDHHDFCRPFATLSLLSEQDIMFGAKLMPLAAGKFGGDCISVPLPVGSCLVLAGNSADVAKHCVPPVQQRRVSITLRRMGESHGRAVREHCRQAGVMAPAQQPTGVNAPEPETFDLDAWQQPPALALRKYWDQRHLLWSRYDQGIAMDEGGWFTATPEEIALRQAERLRGDVVVDGMAGCGGNIVALARVGCPRVVAIDLEDDRLQCTLHNAGIYGVAGCVETRQGDFLQLADGLEANSIFMSPPWGGPEYGKAKGLFDVRKPFAGLTVGLRGLIDVARKGLRTCEGPRARKQGTLAFFLPRNAGLDGIKECIPRGATWEVVAEHVQGQRKPKGLTVYVTFQ